MRFRSGPVTVVLMSLLVGACGITTSPDRTLADDIEEAAEATAGLDSYEFSWTADYRLSESETGRSSLTVTGSGVVDAEAGDVDAVVEYDEDFLDVTRSLFADETITRVQAFTRVVGDAVYIRGFHAAALVDDLSPAYETWYEVGGRSQNVQDPLVRSDVLPADVLPVVVEPLVDAGELSVVADRDFVLDLGTRFSRSLYDFGLLIGGGDFDVSVEIADGLIGTLILEGDDPGTGVERFTFVIRFTPIEDPAIGPPPDPVSVR
ncbi:MAG: hypothetical protein OEQ47_05245 [Acidimicrobiia bacterium]|nr:hypothetical protein [Acidimicrobiia bacterium]